MTADPRVTAAREFLAHARRWLISDLPPSVIAREDGELRYQLGQVLDVVTETAGRVLSQADMEGVYSALADAAGCIEDRAARQCDACDAHAANLCAEHDADLDTVTAYRALAARLGGEEATDAEVDAAAEAARAEVLAALGKVLDTEGTLDTVLAAAADAAMAEPGASVPLAELEDEFPDLPDQAELAHRLLLVHDLVDRVLDSETASRQAALEEIGRIVVGGAL